MHSKKLLFKVSNLATKFFKLCHRNPCIAVIIVGEDPASKLYVKNKIRTAKECSIKSIKIHFPKELAEQDLFNEIEKLNTDENIDGILVQLPLPKHIQDRYANWNNELGKRIHDKRTNLEKLHQIVIDQKIKPQPKSGQQELLENILNKYL